MLCQPHSGRSLSAQFQWRCHFGLCPDEGPLNSPWVFTKPQRRAACRWASHKNAPLQGYTAWAPGGAQPGTRFSSSCSCGVGCPVSDELHHPPRGAHAYQQKEQVWSLPQACKMCLAHVIIVSPCDLTPSSSWLAGCGSGWA